MEASSIVGLKSDDSRENFGDKIKAEMLPTMALKNITACTDIGQDQIKNIKFVLQNSEGQTLELQSLGATSGAFSCKTVSLQPDEVITSLSAAYSSQSIRSISIVTNAGRIDTWGTTTNLNQRKIWRFDTEHELIGYQGIGSVNSIQAFGVIVFDRNSCGDEATEE